MAISGLTRIPFAPPLRALSSMRKTFFRSPSKGTDSRSSETIRASGGSSVRSRRAKLSVPNCSPERRCSRRDRYCAPIRQARIPAQADTHGDGSLPLYLPGYGEHVSCLCRRNFFFHMPSVARRGAGARGEGPPRKPGIFSLPGAGRTCKILSRLTPRNCFHPGAAPTVNGRHNFFLRAISSFSLIRPRAPSGLSMNDTPSKARTLGRILDERWNATRKGTPSSISIRESAAPGATLPEPWTNLPAASWPSAYSPEKKSPSGLPTYPAGWN